MIIFVVCSILLTILLSIAIGIELSQASLIIKKQHLSNHLLRNISFIATLLNIRIVPLQNQPPRWMYPDTRNCSSYGS